MNAITVSIPVSLIKTKLVPWKCSIWDAYTIKPSIINQPVSHTVSLTVYHRSRKRMMNHDPMKPTTHVTHIVPLWRWWFKGVSFGSRVFSSPKAITRSLINQRAKIPKCLDDVFSALLLKTKEDLRDLLCVSSDLS